MVNPPLRPANDERHAAPIGNRGGGGIGLCTSGITTIVRYTLRVRFKG